jgi:hypothetical protein
MIEEYQQIIKYKRLGIVNYDKFTPTPETIKFDKVINSKNSSVRSVRMTYNDKTLMIKTNKLQNLFSLSREEYHTKKLTFSFDITTAKGKQFYDSMVELQNLVAKEAYKNRVEWGLGRISNNMTEMQVRDQMTPIIKENWDEKKAKAYPPTFSVNFSVRQNESTGEKDITSEVYDQNGKIMEMNQVNKSIFTRGTYCKILMYARGVWISPGFGYGICFRIKQVKVYPRLDMQKPIGFCLIDD